MYTQFHTLPPRKRLSLRQKQRNYVDYSLPTKKRSQSRRPKITTLPEAVTYPLPTKKRVRAFQPEYVDYSICEVYDDAGDYSLPAKKRMDSRVVVRDVDLDDDDAGMVSVQNRKRVCAFKPDFVFDLNVEYKPSLNEDCKLESDFGNVVIESREVKEALRMNVGCYSDDKIGSNCADLRITDEFGGVVIESNKTCEVVDELGREKERLIECEKFEIVSNFDNAEVTVKESSEMVEEMENADEIDRCEVNINENEEEDSEYVDKFNGGSDGFGNAGERDACIDNAFDSYCGKSTIDNANGFNGVLEGCCNEVQIDAPVEGAIDDNGNGDKLVTGNGEALENADALNGAYVGNNVNGVAKGCCNEEETYAWVDGVNDGNGDFDNTSTPTNIHGGGIGGSEAEHLKVVNSTDAATECDTESEDGVVCEICQSTDGDPSDPIVFCDRCDLTAHASCYGNPLIKGIPEGDWFCQKCIFQAKTPLNPISCCLCPSTGGVLKPTNDGRWAHIVCAVYVPEAFFLDPEGRESIDVSNISAKRFKKKCYICEKIQGCAIDCSESKCSLSFHVTCGLEKDLCIEYREGNMKKGAIVAGFCHDHTKLWKKQQQTGKFKIVARKSDDL